MTFVLVDNTNNLKKAIMTPIIIDFFKKKDNIDLIVISKDDVIPTSIKIDGFILSGGPILLSNFSLLSDYVININILINYPNIPIMGICLGFQILCMVYGGTIARLNNIKEGIKENIDILYNDSVLFKNIEKKYIEVYQYHNDYIKSKPDGFEVSSINGDGTIQSVENINKLRFGTQFHPESSEQGEIILNNFVNFCLSFKK